MNRSLAGSNDCLGILVQSFTPTSMQTSIVGGQRCLRTKAHYSMKHLPHVVEHPHHRYTAFPDSLVKEIVSAAEGGRRSIFLHPLPYRVVLYSFVAGLNKYTWMHVKAMHSACVNFFFLMPHKHKRNPFKRNK